MNKLKKLMNKKAIGFVDFGVKVLIAVVIGALTLGGFYALAKENVLPTAKSKIESLFDYSGNDGLNIQQPLTGDLNNDGVVNNDDMTILKSELLNTTGNYDPAALDINGDGVFDVVDLVRMKKIISQQS